MSWRMSRRRSIPGARGIKFYTAPAALRHLPRCLRAQLHPLGASRRYIQSTPLLRRCSAPYRACSLSVSISSSSSFVRGNAVPSFSALYWASRL